MNEKRRPEGRRSETDAAKLPNLADHSNRQDDDPAMFDVVIERDAYSRRTTLEPSAFLRGPGPRPATTGPRDAQAPPWWWAEAERIVLALVECGHAVSADDLHERFPGEPSASGAAFGALFARLARRGTLREVGWVKSRRPEARGRRVILWGRQ